MGLLEDINEGCTQLHGMLHQALDREPARGVSGEGGSHQHRLNDDRLSTIQDGKHRHLFEIDGVIVATDEDGEHWHAAPKDVGRVDVGGDHGHRIQLPSGTIVETGASVSKHDHDMLLRSTGVDGTHFHTLMLPDGREINSITPADYARLFPAPVTTVTKATKIDETENQFRVRLRPPSQFEEGSFRQGKKPIKPSKPQVFGVFARLMGATSTTLQSLRFPKGQGWTRERVIEWIRTHRDDLKKSTRHPNPLQRAHKCKFGDEPATLALIWAEGRAFIAVCHDHEATGRRIIKGNDDSVDRVVKLPQSTGKTATDDTPEPVATDNVPRLLEKSQTVRIFKADRPGEKRFVQGIVLEPEVEDSQTDIYSEEEVRFASDWFMEHDGKLGLMHEEALGEGAVLLENFIMPVDGVIGGQNVKKGSWIMSWRIVDDDIWAAVKAGRFTGFSIGGDSIRIAEEVAA